MMPEEHILLNTIFDIEKNDSLNYHGSIDEIYLTNVAIATIQNSHSTPWNYNSVRKRDADELFDLIENKLLENITRTNETELYSNTTETLLKPEETTKPTTLFVKAQKVNFIGRPKSYNIEELNDDTDHSDRCKLIN